MKKISLFAVLCALGGIGYADAAGTYYTGGYQSPQNTYAQPGYVRTGYSQTGYTPQRYAQPATAQPRAGNYTDSDYSRYSPYQQQQQGQPQQRGQQQQGQQKQPNSGTQSGFYLNGGYSYETAQWQFDMNQSGSILHYDNIAWNVFDIGAGYVFGGNTKMQVDAGVKFGFQGAESYMVDDDITNGGYFITQWIDEATDTVIGNEFGQALSVGTTGGGSMFGFNVGFGLTDFFKLGNTRITPSIGYRHFNYKLKTDKNYGLSFATSACFSVPDSDEMQCDPAIIVNYPGPNGTTVQQIIWRDSITDEMTVGNDAESIDTGDTYYFQQPGTSHSYEVTWSGPYLALDMVYDINQNNSVGARVELGLPGYEAIGDQPYRFDWQHPKSIEDSAGIGSAINFGLSGNWSTAITNSIMLTVGMTYNYYSVSDADAKTYLNEGFYMGVYDTILEEWLDNGFTEADMLDPDTGNQTAINIKNIETECPGWVCSTSGEVNSFYKSLGIRVGFNAKF